MTDHMTLQLRRPFGRTLILTLLWFCILLAGSEWFARTKVAKSLLLRPSIGSRHGQFENQLARLEWVVQQDGSVDCIFLGSSLVWLGVKPDVFTQTYNQETGEKIRCFNFGVSAMPANAAAAVAKILVEDYHPKLLIYGLSARDLAIPNDAEDSAVILETPWVQYRMGQFSIQGWLYDHSYFYRNLKSLNNLVRLNFNSPEEEFGLTLSERYGFLPKQEPITDKSLTTANEYAHQWLYNYNVQQENILGLKQISRQRDQNLQVVVIDMPVPPVHFDYFKNGRQDFDQYIDQVSNVLASERVVFWQMTDHNMISESGWWDPSHLNEQGAQLFSEWLGHRVGTAVNQGEIISPVSDLMTIPNNK